MASWTAPSTWVAAAVLTASQLNTQIRDNFLFLKDRTQAGDGSITTVAGTTVPATVTFPVPFPTAPRVTVTPITSSPNLIQMSVSSGTTATACTVNMYRSSGSGAVAFHWHAVLQ